jgi:tetratricopeptide (TPR) repeat protein
MPRVSQSFRSGLFSTRRVRVIAAPAACCLAAVIGTASAHADTPLSRDFMGSGMHAFHAGSFQQSIDDLTAAIESGCQDPRAYYFRALAMLQQGREDEAVADMQEGALLESAGPGSIVVGRSLERVQGRHRLMLERYRRRALIEQQARDQRRIEQRYTDLIESEPERLRQRRPEPLVAPATGSTSTPSSVTPNSPPAVPANAADDPFSTPVQPADDTPMDDASGDDPFAAPGDDPFGGTAPPAGDDPFGEVDPFGGDSGPSTTGGDEADPFSTPPATPAAPPAGNPPADGEGLFEDPFGDSSSGINRPRGSGTVGDQQDQQTESLAAEPDDVFDQRDEQEEMEAAAAGDAFDQRDQQQERDAAAGEGGALVEPVFD